MNKHDSGQYECFLSNGERDIIRLTVNGKLFKPKENVVFYENYVDQKLLKMSTSVPLNRFSRVFTSCLEIYYL